MTPLDAVKQILEGRGWVANYVIIGRGGKRYRVAFAKPRTKRALIWGRVDTRREAAIASLGWSMKRLGAGPKPPVRAVRGEANGARVRGNPQGRKRPGS